jgi:hypothetical protein
LLDAYRYARDAAALDFLGVTDHLDNCQIPFNRWLSQKMADLFQIKGSFAAFCGYERSVAYPNGDRNVFSTKPNAGILPVSEGEGLGWQGAAGLFWHLRRVKGFSIPHSPGRTSGTDWRDTDPEVESVVEIYQGMRDTYEYPRAPRPYRLGTCFLDAATPVPRASSSEASASFRRRGFVWNALAKGYKLGFIASSDHLSTHVSYAFLLAEELTPEGLREAMKSRRTYAATDNIILDVHFYGSDGEHLMGEEFASLEPVRIKARIYGTDSIQQVDVIKNGTFIYTTQPGQSQCELDFVDPEAKDTAKDAENYYYLRVIQRNGEIAWGSPAWVKYVR